MTSRIGYWVSIGTTESGDDLPPVVWSGGMPTKEMVDDHYRKLMPNEYEEVGGVHHKTVLASIGYSPSEFVDKL